MKNNLIDALNKVDRNIVAFKKEPILDANNARLRGALMILNRINISKSELAVSDFKEIRLRALKANVEIVELFEKHYIKNYKPARPYYLHLLPPIDAIDETAFGSPDPDEIKNPKEQEKYKQDIEENNRIGMEISFQGELTKLKYLLETPDVKAGHIATVEYFIKNNYENNNVDDKAEAQYIIESSNLNGHDKNKIINDIF